MAQMDNQAAIMYASEQASQAVVAVLHPTSPKAVREAATVYLESIKNGEVHVLWGVALTLFRGEGTVEPLYGLQMLHHLIRARWGELTVVEQAQLGESWMDVIGRVAMFAPDHWPLKSLAAAVVAEVSKRGGAEMWTKNLKRLIDVAMSSESGPVHYELAALVLRCLSEDVTVHNEDLETARRKELLTAVAQTLPQTLPFLYTILEKNFTGMNAQQDHERQRPYAAAVTAGLSSAIAYADWAPVTEMMQFGLVEACKTLLSHPQFRLNACEVMKRIAAYKRKPADDKRKPADEEELKLFNAAMKEIFVVLTLASISIMETMKQNMATMALSPEQSYDGFEEDLKYGECLCDAMVGLGSQNFQCVAGSRDIVQRYIEIMLAFLEFPMFSIHALALPLWQTLVRDTVTAFAGTADAKASGALSGAVGIQPGQEKRDLYAILTDGSFAARLLGLAYQHLLKSPENRALDERDLSSPLDFSQYHGRLLELIRCLATLQPLVAVTMVAGEINTNFVADGSTPPSTQTLPFLERTRTMLEAVVNGIPESVMAAEAFSKGGIYRLLESIFEKIYSIEWKAPVLVELHGQHIDAMGAFLKHAGPNVADNGDGRTIMVFGIQKLFTLLESLQMPRTDQAVDAAALREISRARLQVCTSFLRVAKSADSALLPYASTIAVQMGELERKGLLPRGEMNLLGEALLIVGFAGGDNEQLQVLGWLLEPLKKCWVQLGWQERYLTGANGLVNLLSCRNEIFLADGGSVVRTIHEQVWLVFHIVTFLERTYRRCFDSKKQKGQVVSGQAAPESMDSLATGAVSPLANELILSLEWILPPLLKLLRSMHELWSDQIKPSLPAEVLGGLAMGVPEQASLTGKGGTWPTGDGPTQMDSISGSMETRVDIRSWLKGIRDSGYKLLGIAALHLGDGFFAADGRAAVMTIALVENIQYMEMHHVRLLLHSVVIFFVKSCPRPKWRLWLPELLRIVLVHCQKVLWESWSSLLQEGAVKCHSQWMPSLATGPNDGTLKQANVEMIVEKLLRDLTRETCYLLSVIAASASSSPSVQPAGEYQAVSASITTFGSDTMMDFLMQDDVMAAAALHIGISALEWQDSEAVHKAAAFCGAVVSMPLIFTKPGLADVVGDTMFGAAIRGLTLDSNATAQSELIGLLREIYMRFSSQSPFSSHSPAPIRVLLSLPSITEVELANFDKALGKTSSVKEQRQHMKTLLLAAGGDQLKALQPHRNLHGIANVTHRSLDVHLSRAAPAQHAMSHFGDSGPIGLASIM